MYFSLNDANYWYEVHGEGVPVVCLHGFTGTSQTWSSFLTSWQASFQVITVDLPGHGKTKVEHPRSMEDCCEDLRQLLDHLQLESVHLLGYSMGGRTALSFAMLYPNHVRSLILESASPGLSTSEERMARIERDDKLASKITREGIIAFVDFWENIPLFATQKQLPENIQAAIRMERLEQDEAGLAQSLCYMGTGKQPSWWNDLQTFVRPVLLLVGEMDHKFIKINVEMQKVFPNSTLKMVEKSGHAIHVEQPAFFDKLVTEFLKNNQ
ncbi:2-succinyl-6-hydroxy-2,4-cyclohexadiene-1-carboxylate synthase [Oceanobacillus halotolerans]|uniref:2-succinyl-6-hydroxy-2, 4-cyclohexadiene-1-carboxylate synthase n=1 Tax=Oceanobacillus halotolerans TaxID=2663380 RepID=UPI0013DCE048|nr:2-succinyl-6-hydroxy-2,4-cyclohexadiene-1-carboxylate synthase [Oceanobacillus halotolerans]